MTQTQTPTEPTIQSGPATTRNPAAMALSIFAAALVILGGLLLPWLTGGTGPAFKGTDAPVSLLWSTDVAVEVTFLSSAGFVVAGVGLIVLIGALLNRGALLVIGGALALIAGALVVMNFMRLEAADITFGMIGFGLWGVILGGVVAMVAGISGRRGTATA